MFVEYRNITNSKGEQLEIEIIRVYPFNYTVTAFDTRSRVGTNLNVLW